MQSTCSAAPNLCLEDPSSSSADGNSIIQQLTIAAATALSAIGLSAILLFQLDEISRRVLSGPRLLAKRRQEYKYVIAQSCEFASLLMRKHVGGGKGVYDPKSEDLVCYNDQELMEQLIQDILDTTKSTPVIVAIEQDLLDEHGSSEYQLFLAFPPSSDDGATPAAPALYRRVCVPLVKFTDMLASAFERQLTSSTLCFVADASSGLGSEILTLVMQKCQYGVATISNPAWMFLLAFLMSKKTHDISMEQFERILFALCRLDAWRVRHSVGVSKTILFQLPGQACVPLLLPLIQKVFPHERHVFVYDGCCSSVETGMALRKKYGTTYRQHAEKEEWDTISAMPSVISSTFSMASLRHNRELPETLAKLNGSHASIVEAWMASVDAFLEMKSKEKKNFYTPFVCRIGFLMKKTGIGNGDGSDLSGLALKNVLQYITGSKSRALTGEVMDAALVSLKELQANFEANSKNYHLKEEEKVLIEKCVFTHKSILIGDKTLLDTVQPKEDWSLKAAKKLKSCMCCSPGDDDEEEEEEQENIARKNKDTPGLKDGRQKYVNATATFAFDPTKFH